ncbi:alpha/beta fold hydrolase [Parasedimentitalea psychrophila]|uniref:Alpha/beta hydrolase n=1 Tax=Parasedimentitalea psychrophila TaxID=2997337 RepID=A0A9Y2KX69_9RHOB|nr:alpha/beta hydrolase [Parasedimentitalea psychrophila]WIY24144.1 alpha/beta hydrolase [Parasedimentitalea psychrophila]
MTWTTLPRSKQGDLSTIVSGDGPPLLLIHGVGLRGEAWCGQIDTLSTNYKITAVDMPGHGASVLPAGDMTLTRYADRIAATLSEPSVVIGHSMGAMIALDIAIRFPGLVRGVVALNAIYQRGTAARKAVRARAAGLDGLSHPDPSAALERWFGTATSPAREACRGWLSDVDPRGYAAAYQVFANEDGPAPDDLATLPCPALFMTGSKEPNSTPAMSHAMAALAPRGRTSIIEGAAHMMPMTHADQVNAGLMAFAQECFR